MKNGLLCAVIETQMNTQLLFYIKVKKQMVKLGPENFTIFLATLTMSIMISIVFCLL